MKKLNDHDIVLEEPGHRYRLVDGRKIDFTSCTEFVERFFEPFEPKAVARKLIETSPTYRERTVSSILSEWERAERIGTEVHKEIADAIESTEAHRPPPKHHQSVAALTWLKAELPAAEFIYYPECIVYSETLHLAGTTDLIAVNRTSGQTTIVDWKTNKKIDRSGYRGKHGIRGPARQMQDCHLVKDGLQLSLYAYLLELEYALTASSLIIVHLTPSGRKRIDCSNARDNVKRLLEFDRLG